MRIEQPGERRVYSTATHGFAPTVPGTSFSRARGRAPGPGAWQVAARYNYLCLDDGQVQGGVLNEVPGTVGAKPWVSGE